MALRLLVPLVDAHQTFGCFAPRRAAPAPRRGARGKAAAKGKAAAGGEGPNPFGNMVGTNSDYTKNYGDVDPDDESATLEQLEGAIEHHEKGIESSLQRTLRCGRFPPAVLRHLTTVALHTELRLSWSASTHRRQ